VNTIRLTLLATAAIGAAAIGSASAMPFGNGAAAPGDSFVQDVRLVCDQFGRCYETRRSHRAARYYAPREYDRPAYYGGYHGGHDYGYYNGPRVGIGVGPVGIGVGIGGW
jgi:hypothetical protein